MKKSAHFLLCSPIVGLCGLWGLWGLGASAAFGAESIRFSVIRTGEATTLEANVFSGGSLLKKTKLNHSAILIQHGTEAILFDSGLGSEIDAQFSQDMPFWAKPFFPYEKLTPAAQQIPAEMKDRIKKVYLSHVHWDHASGLHDFPGACAAIAEDERREVTEIRRRTTFPTQLYNPDVRWCEYAWSNTPFRGFEKSHDIFGDQSAVLVPLPGHSHGSTGLFLKTASRTFFFVGDTAWSRKGLMLGKGKSFAASMIVDRDRDQTLESIRKVKDFAEKNPSIAVIPAHDAEAQDELGYFPKWVD